MMSTSPSTFIQRFGRSITARIPFGSKAPAPRDPALVREEDEARMFILMNERIRREAEIWWPYNVFMTSSQDAARHIDCPPVIDPAGRARHLVLGPFERLRPGTWRATLVLRLSAAAARRPLSVGFGTEPNFSVFDVPYGVPGLHRIDLEWTFGEEDDAELWVWLRRAAFDGEIGFLGVGLTVC